MTHFLKLQVNRVMSRAEKISFPKYNDHTLLLCENSTVIAVYLLSSEKKKSAIYDIFLHKKMITLSSISNSLTNEVLLKFVLCDCDS